MFCSAVKGGVGQFELWRTIYAPFLWSPSSTAVGSLRGPIVPIARLLRSGTFDPADIDRITAAYEAALQLLRLVDRNDSICELLAAKIIEVFRAGESDPPRLCARALKELGVDLPG